MKITTITMALAFAAGTLGMAGAAGAQDHGMRQDQSMRHDNMGHDRADHMRGGMRHDRHGWGHAGRHCRTMWRHHHRVKQCW